MTETSKRLPTVAILLATYNGIKWIKEQVDSLLSQSEVDVKLFISDDSSTDGTKEWINALASQDERVVVLPLMDRLGSPGKNFYRLIMYAEVDNFDYIALADQDDIWLSNKLSMQTQLAKKYRVDGVSSNVVAFWNDDKKALIDKAQPLRKLDFLFESAGPGCSFLITNRLFSRIKAILLSNQACARDVVLHDWLIYAICRSVGMRWHIEIRPTLKYRQHETNAVGVNLGIKAKKTRLQQITNNWYRTEICKVARVVRSLSQDAYITDICSHILNDSKTSRLVLLKHITELRRNTNERLFLGLIIASGMF